jgi:hypothetical protein
MSNKLKWMYVSSFQVFGALVTTNYEDIKSLIESMLLVTALLLTLAFDAVTKLNHQELMEADARHFQTFNFTPTGISQCMSYTYIEQSMESLKYLLVSLAMGLCMYLSLAFTNSAEDPEAWQNWSKLFCLGIISGYSIILWSAVCLLNAGTTLSFMTYPNYSFNASELYDPTNKTMRETNFGWALQLKYMEEVKSTMTYSFAAAGTILGVHVFGTLIQFLMSCRYQHEIFAETREYNLPDCLNLSKNECKLYTAIFQREKLTMEQIYSLSPKDLKYLGIPFGHALLILKHKGRSNAACARIAARSDPGESLQLAP